MRDCDKGSKYRKDSLPNNVDFLQRFFKDFEYCGNVEDSDKKVEMKAKRYPNLSEEEKQSLKNLIENYGRKSKFFFFNFTLIT